MIYDVNSGLFRSFLAVSGGGHGGPKVPKDNRAKAGEKAKDNKPTMVE
jgi:hypothetical protein